MPQQRSQSSGTLRREDLGAVESLSLAPKSRSIEVPFCSPLPHNFFCACF